MSVYIRGMEMPNEEQEPLRIELYADGTAVLIMPPDNDCEYTAIPVPDHGDLIERDALKKECQENAKRGIGLWVDYMDISLAPTIIPADYTDKEGEVENVER